MSESRKVIDCRWFPSETKCTLTISGKEGEVIEAAMEHAVKCHGEKKRPELREEIRKLLRDEKNK